MKASHRITLIILLAFAGLAVAGLLLTSESSSSEKAGNKQNGTGQQPSIDQTPLQTAANLASQSLTPDEKPLAMDAERLADHEVDLAFAAALRDFKSGSTVQTPKALAFEKRIQQDSAQMNADKARVKRLTAGSAHAQGDRQVTLQGQLEIAEAQLDLDQDDLADAQQDLARAGGDVHSHIQRLWQEHQATEHANGKTRVETGPASSQTQPSGSLIERWRNWNALRAKKDQLVQVRQYALNAAARLARHHDSMEKQVQQEQPQMFQAAPSATSASRAQAPALAPPPMAQSAMMSSLQRMSQVEKDLEDMDQRIQDLRDLNTTYGKWIALIAEAQRAAVHEVIKAILWIVLLVLFILLINLLVDHLLARFKLERKQQLTLRGVVRFGVEAVAVLIILFVIFGSPNQILTVLGLATAGLTVALKDFVVSFCGWFVLMGRNGIRVGDWVEVNGVRGEVMEIGLLRTILLETGNWTEAGHPTGRQVAFLNSFAVEGYYFNFTTSGQWLWDEFQVTVPSEENPYPLIEKIRAIVAEETREYAQTAEKEWKRATSRYGVGAFSALPSVNVQPTGSGVQVMVRYMTRANERSEVRQRLNLAVVDLFHGAKAAPAEVETQPAPTGASGH
ncbi:MAG TPA: mechanosensitive ion channel domain-containing protein [Terriglobia bacterium]|nr:mechanosensitive ion channel domain-containing protein [Terriglobia bacterium]